MSQTLQNQLLLSKSMNGIISFDDGAGTTISNGQVITNGVNTDTITANTLTVPSLTLDALTVNTTANLNTATTTVQTVTTADNSTKAASTAFVNNFYNNKLTVTNTFTAIGGITTTQSPIIKNQYLRAALFSNAASLTISGTIYPVYCLAPTANMTITLPTASGLYDGAVICFCRVGGTNTVTVNSATSNIYNNSLTLTNVILFARQYYRQIICQSNNGVYGWYYADSDALLYAASTWYGAVTYITNPTFASNRALYYNDTTNNVISLGPGAGTGGIVNLFCGLNSGNGVSGNYNCAYGYGTLNGATTSQGCCTFGYNSGTYFRGSTNQVGVGLWSGQYASRGDSNCTYIGYAAGTNDLARYDYSIAIGAFAQVFASNIIVLGGVDPTVPGQQHPMTYTMGGATIPATKNFNLLGCFISATQSITVNNSTLSLTAAKTVFVGSAVTQLYLPLPDAADVGKVFTIVKSGSGGGTLWGLALRRAVATTFTINANGFDGNTVYSLDVSEFSVDLMVTGSAASGVNYAIIYNNPDVIRTPTTFISAFFLPPQSAIPATRTQINSIIIGQDALITVSSGVHNNSHVVIGAGAGKLIGSNPAAFTIIGREGFGQATALSSGCSSLGYRAGYNITTGASSNVTLLGANTSVAVATTAYSQSTCVGYASVISRSNEVVLGTATETVYVPGILQVQNNYVASASPTIITTTSTLSGVLYQYYSFSTDAGSIVLTLPAASAAYLGCSITFRRVGSNSGNTLTSASSNIIQRNQFVTSTMIVDNGIYQTKLVCMVLSATPTYGWFQITD